MREAGLFAGWQSRLNSDGQAAWGFGTNQQVPALRIKGVVYRDNDGDGLLNAEDEFPNNWEASLDTDNDGAIDFWREGCGEACRAASSLVLDQLPEQRGGDAGSRSGRPARRLEPELQLDLPDLRRV